jgi:Taurine catabolism dioxygenase TauD, TfdA family
MQAATETDTCRPDPAGWRAAEMRRQSDWTITFEERHRAEIMDAVRASAARGEAIAEISRESFRPTRLAPLLEEAHRAVVDGRGFVLMRGLPIEDLDREQTVRAYFGIGAYFGVARPQNRAGHLVGHVINLGEDASDPQTRLYRTNARQRFHIDSCDVVGLLCLRPAKAGGASALCSSDAVFEEIARSRPDLAAVLEQPFVYDRKGEIPAGKGPHYRMPIAHRHGGYTTIFFARDFIDSAQRRFDDVPRLSAQQIEALDLVERLAESDEFRLDMDFRPGDMQFVHNHVVLHARTAYQDWDEPERRRHLLRLWLSAHGGRPLPEVFEERYGPLEPGRPRGGISVPGQVLKVPLEPE